MSANRPFRVAIIGAGPAGMYAAAQLLEQRGPRIEIDIYEKLPTPWGLVRAGVAPDHPEKKLVIDRQFDFYLKDPRVRLFGNVEIGTVIRHDELVRWYTAVIYSVGASGDVKMGIPGEDLPGSWSAREFVGFYNGHPDYGDFPFDLSHHRAVVVGNGNVALDVARILTAPVETLERTDIADRALAVLKTSQIREVVILGRRDHLHAACNNPELEEFDHLNGVDVSVEGVDLAVPGSADLDWQARRKNETLVRLSSRPRDATRRRVVFRFLASPVAVLGAGRVQQVVIANNALHEDGSGVPAIKPNGREECVDAGILFRAVGYRGTAFPGLPYDERLGVIRNLEGRVFDGDQMLAGVYVSGWIKRGCRGIIGSNKKCAHETVQHLLTDVRAGRLSRDGLDKQAVLAMIHERQPELVMLRDWNRIDYFERNAGRAQNRPRVKLESRDQLFRTALRRSDNG